MPYSYNGAVYVSVNKKKTSLIYNAIQLTEQRHIANGAVDVSMNKKTSLL